MSIYKYVKNQTMNYTLVYDQTRMEKWYRSLNSAPERYMGLI